MFPAHLPASALAPSVVEKRSQLLGRSSVAFMKIILVAAYCCLQMHAIHAEELLDTMKNVESLNPKFLAALKDMKEVYKDRKWKTKDGKHAVRAIFSKLKISDDAVEIYRIPGGLKTVPLEILSEDDVEFLDLLITEERKCAVDAISALASDLVDARADALKAKESAQRIAEEAKLKDTKIDELTAMMENEREKFRDRLAQFMPNNAIAAEGKNITTFERIETFKERYVDKTVQLLECQVRSVGRDYQEDAPGVKGRSSNGLITTFQKSKTSWVTVYLIDSEGNGLGRAYAEADKWGEFLLSIDKRKDRINVEGVVYDIHVNDWYALYIHKMEKVPR